MIGLYPKGIRKDSNGKPFQWDLYTPWHQIEPLAVVSAFEDKAHVAVLGFGKVDFYFIINNIDNIVEEVEENLKGQIKALRRIISVGVFE